MTVYTPTTTVNARDLNVTAQAGATAAGPAANAVLATMALANANALYEVVIYAFVSGTTAVAESNNMVLKQGSTTLMALPVSPTAASAVPVTVVLNSALGQVVTVAVGAASPTGTASYNVSMTGRQVTP